MEAIIFKRKQKIIKWCILYIKYIYIYIFRKYLKQKNEITKK